MPEHPAHIAPRGPRRIAHVLIDSPLPQLDRLFDYSLPAELVEEAVPGVRVKVPLRSAGRVIQGFVVGVGEETDDERTLSEIDTVISAAEVLPDRLYALARAVADRAAGSANDVLRLAIPRRMVRAEKAWLAREAAPTIEVDAGAASRALATLAEYPDLDETLAGAGRVALDARPGVAGSIPAWAELLAAAAVLTISRGESAVIAVPDHRDLARLEAALADIAPEGAVLRLDAELPAQQRYANYLRTLDDAPAIVIGNRSAVYAPVTRLGMLALWDDGDSLFDEPLAPYVHARDAALVRQKLEGGALVFCGHSRSADVQRLVEIGFLTEPAPARRVTPKVILGAPQDTPATGRIPSAAFRSAREVIEHGPVLVQVARPGYAPTLVCGECRAPARCQHCGGPLFAPARGATPTCAWCARDARGWQCAHCEATTVRLASSGSERTADELGRAFAGVKIIVADGAHPVETVGPEPALVIATRGAEPIAEGGYRAVLLLDGDRMLQAPDLRIGESCLRWWSNAAALAAPGAPVHLVAVTGPVARALATWSQPAYARGELVERAPLKMPPAVRIARIEGDAPQVDEALVKLGADAPRLAPDAVIGPVPAPEVSGRKRARALVRFEYGLGSVVSASLRASVVAAAVSSRARRTRGPAEPGRSRPPANTLSVRLDVADPEL
ncbi:putative primosomal protein N' [Microbacterium sorbitolivorans]|uniref:Probable replication restart protein PriA n=1 Tax=Microbacterium sorbitolivorans TaxID=1867410 RepID=A0A367Y7I5_9MICO|nr:primosomal protein N' [Microbacterium sorbitolivorans]RCK61580.1 primosomal protein N' [Microbacterium sorbitolivorans]GGF30970.1 putative primosomal protein N' [Microbacterium sorbitolivorans]